MTKLLDFKKPKRRTGAYNPLRELVSQYFKDNTTNFKKFSEYTIKMCYDTMLIPYTTPSAFRRLFTDGNAVDLEPNKLISVVGSYWGFVTGISINLLSINFIITNQEIENVGYAVLATQTLSVIYETYRHLRNKSRNPNDLECKVLDLEEFRARNNPQ